MEQVKVDRRVKRTKLRLRQALNTLMETKTIRDISIKELTEMADINRGTFYLHYKDIFHLMDSIEEEIFNDFDNLINNREGEESAKPLIILEDIFKFLADNSKMCLAFLGPNGDVAFVNRLKNLIRERCLQDWISYYNEVNSENFGYYFAFILSGFTGLFQEWLDTGMKETPAQMATLAGRILLYGIKVLY